MYLQSGNLPPPLNDPPGRVGMEAEIELFPFSRPARKGGVIDLKRKKHPQL
jgi:hypothetical protein